MSGQDVVVARTPDELLVALARVIGFYPTDSLVIMGTGGGPTARIDTCPLPEIVAGMTPALGHWGNGVVVVGYGTGQSLIQPVAAWLGQVGVTVKATLHASNEPAKGTTGVPRVDARPVYSSRRELEAKAEALTDVAEVERMALDAYADGAGAKAWVFHDRAVALGSTSPEMQRLKGWLEGAVDPKGVTP